MAKRGLDDLFVKLSGRCSASLGMSLKAYPELVWGSYTQNGEKFLKFDTEALQRRVVAQGQRLPFLPTAVYFHQGATNGSGKTPDQFQICSKDLPLVLLFI